jgi:hypothetical protein
MAPEIVESKGPQGLGSRPSIGPIRQQESHALGAPPERAAEDPEAIPSDDRSDELAHRLAFDEDDCHRRLGSLRRGEEGQPLGTVVGLGARVARDDAPPRSSDHRAPA